MELVLNINKTPQQNAETYFDKAKKFKKKIPGIKKTLLHYRLLLSKHEKAQADKTIALNAAMIKNSLLAKKKVWFDKFRWFISSNDFLIVGGRDAVTNEILIKKHLEPTDLVFHTELPGSPFVLIKNPENNSFPEETINEAAEFCGSFSKSWKSGRTTAEVYHILPEQVSKEVQAGFGKLAKGSFMIYGKRNFINVSLNIAICIHDGKVMAGSLSAIKKHAPDGKYAVIIPGNDKLSDVAKKVQKIIGGGLDEIIRALPSECSIKKR
jgi:predicted ribosome quality control (RQC) complex YloA/Tae2 family protein